MANATCSVEVCDRPAKARGWCQAHWKRWRLSGEVPTGPVGRWRTTTCSVDGCGRKHDSLGYCAPHRKRVAAHGTPGPAEIRPRSVGDAADYGLMHARVKKARGRAAQFQCVECDGPAYHWAYDHLDPEERVDAELGLAFSLDPKHYRPMCASCHKRFDMAGGNVRRDTFGRFAPSMPGEAFA